MENSDLCIAGYLSKAGNPIKNNVSTGDLNRGRRACRLLETWSPCSHPFAILPVSAVSDAQKLATGNFLHVRARAFCVTFCTPQKVTIRFPFGSFPLHGKHAPVGAARRACKGASRFCKPRSNAHRWRYHIALKETKFYRISFLPDKARASVTSSAYSRSPPTGIP